MCISEAFYYDLLQRDIRHFDHRVCPRTDALAEQQLYSFTPVEAYWSGILESGQLPGAEAGLKGQRDAKEWGSIAKAVLHDDFVQQAVGLGGVDLHDFGDFGLCLTGPDISMTIGCECFDMNRSRTVDLRDFAVAQGTITGS